MRIAIRKGTALGVLASGALLLSACATQPASAAADHLPGFWLGLFHGASAIFALIGSLFLHVRIYAFPNSGFWYDFGFIAGFCAFLIVLVLASMARIGGLLTGRS